MSQSVQQNNDESNLLYGTEERRQQLYPDSSSSNYDAQAVQASMVPAPPAQPGAQVPFGPPADTSSGSANATALEYAPPPPSPPHPSVQAGVDHWTATNTGVHNLDGSQSADVGFELLNGQYTGNAPPTPSSVMNGQRSATSMDWEQVQVPPAQPGTQPHLGLSPYIRTRHSATVVAEAP